MLDCVKWWFKVAVVKSLLFSLALFFGGLTLLSVCLKWARQGNSFWVVKERRIPPPVLQDPAFGRHSYIYLKGVKLHYVENGERSKPLMLFLHGFPEFWFSWRKQLAYFSRTHWVVAPDLRGYGESDKPPKVSDYAMVPLAKDIVDLVHALGRKRCILIGHDWGGAISWVVASTSPDIIDKLIILNSPHPAAMAKKLQSSLKQLLKSWYIFFFQLPLLPELCYSTNDLAIFERLFEGSSITPEEIEGYKYTWASKGAFTPPINYYRNILNASAIIAPTPLPKIRAPTLIVWGEDDLALEKDLPELCREYVEQLRIIYIPGANHFVQHDAADEVNRVIEDFLDFESTQFTQ